MARGDRDVNLVIRARNEASRALDSVSSALDELRGAQERTEQGSRATGNQLQQLGSTLQSLRKQAGGSDPFDRLSSSADKAKNSVQQLEQSSSETAAEQQRLAAEMARAERTIDRLSARQSELTAEQQRQAQSARDNKANLAAVTAEIRAAGQATPELTAAQDRSRAAFEQATAAQQRARTALGYVNRAYKTTSKELSRLTRTYDRNAQTLDKQQASLASARQELGRMEATSNEADAAVQKLGTSVRRELLASLQRSSNDLAEYEQSWNEATTAIRRAAQAGEDLNNPSQGLQRQLDTARRSKVAYGEMQAAIQRMRTAVREAGSDVNALSNAQQTFISSLSRVEQRINEVTAEQEQQNRAAREAAQVAERQARQSERAGAAAGRQAQGTRQSAEALDRYNRKAREALSWTQRINGEIVALATSYLGLYAAIEQLRGVADTFQRIEAANNKMLVAFRNDDAAAAREMRFIREQAERLGVQFDKLASQYANLATATRGSNIAGAQTREIFLQIAEAGRVQRLSTEQLEGVFKAIEQMASRGTISMEELREQLGDRLPGAFRIATEAMGVTAAELTSMIENGELMAEDFLPKFAQQLSDLTKPTLDKSLQSYSAELGRFQNEVVKAQETVANAGFIEGMKDALDELTEFFQSDEGVRFFEAIGAASGNFARFLAAIPDYLQEITFILSTLVGLKSVSVVRALGDRFRQMLQNAKPLPTTLGATTTATRSMTAAQRANNAVTGRVTQLQSRYRRSLRRTQTALTTARGRAVALTGAMRGLRVAFGALGGLPGLLITGLSAAFAAWLGHTDDVQAATGRHEEQMQRLVDEYSRVKDAAGDWAKAVEDGIGGITLDQARQNFLEQIESMSAAAEQSFDGLGQRLETKLGRIQMGPGGSFRNLDEYGQRILDLSRDMRAGEITAREYQQSISDLLQDNDLPDQYRDWIESSADLRGEMTDAEERVLEAAAAVKELGGDISELVPVLQETVPSFQQLAEDAGLLSEQAPADPMAELNRQLEILRGNVPSMTSELKLMDNISSIDEILETGKAIEGIDKTSDAFQRFLDLGDQAKRELRDAFDAERFSDARQALSQPTRNSTDLSADLIRQREGFEAQPYWDVNAMRAGFGSDTITLDDGTVKSITEGMRVSVVDANRDLLRRISDIQDGIRQQVGDAAYGRLNPQQQAVLTSNAYNYGSLEPAIVEAVRAGSVDGIAQALRDQATDNDGVNRERREQEAYLFQNSGDINAESAAALVQETLRAEEQRVQRAQEFNSELDRRLEREAQDLQYTDGITRQMAVQRAEEDARMRAQRAGAELSQQQLQLVRENAAAAWDQEAAEERKAEQKERQAAAEQRISNLQQTRQGLMDQIEFFEGQGNVEAANQLREQLDQVTTSLRSAVNEQIRFWQAAKGGEDSAEASAAIVQLQNLKNSLQDTNNTALLTAANLGQTFGESITNGMNNFLSKVRETGNVLKSARAAFLQFASDFLLKIAQMIAQQAILNALKAASNSTGGGFFVSAAQGAAGVNHTGGLAGGNRTRAVAPGWFQNAVQYHTGGIAGLKPNEVPAILERGEEILPEKDPRHRNNGNDATGGDRGVKIVNAIDSGGFVSEGMNTKVGERAVMNFIRSNRSAIKSVLG